MQVLLAHTHTRNLGVKVHDDGSNFSFVFLPIFVAVVSDGYSSLLPIPVGGNGKIVKAIESLFLRGEKIKIRLSKVEFPVGCITTLTQ